MISDSVQRCSAEYNDIFALLSIENRVPVSVVLTKKKKIKDLQTLNFSKEVE